jgi:hypothetical protein
VTGADRHYIALRTDIKIDDRQGSVNPYLDAHWAYTSVVIGNGFRRPLPLWFTRGLAAFMSNTLVSGSSLQVGRVIPWHLQRLNNRGRPTLRELLTADRTSPWYTNAEQRGGFDAEAWAFVHYLMLGDNGAHRPQLDKFAVLVREGQSAAGAIESAFGHAFTLSAFVKGQLRRSKDALPLAERAVALAHGRRSESRHPGLGALDAVAPAERRAAQQVIDALVRAQTAPPPRQDGR